MDASAILLENAANGTVDNCVIESPGFGILIRNSSEIHLINSTFSGYDLGGRGQLGVLMDHSYNCSMDGDFFSLWWQAVHLDFCSRISMINSILTENHDGVDMYYCNNSVLINNTIVQNDNTGIHLSLSSNNSIYGNKIGMNEHQAFDSKGPNLWDDNQSLGNGWGDYSGIGTYAIPGYANSVDRYPWFASDFNYTVRDQIGPTILHGPYITSTGPDIRRAWQFTATAIDPSGVDTVIAFYRFCGEESTSVKLNQSRYYTDEYEGRIGVPDPYNGSIEVYYWANDSLGNSRDSNVVRFSWNGPRPSTPQPSLEILSVAAVVITPLVLLIVFVFLKKTRESHR